MSILEVSNLQVVYGHVTAVWDVSLGVDRGELIAVVGPNGAGKSSLINSVEENLRLGSYTCISRADVSQRLDEVFFLFPRLKERRGQIASSLSGGEQQMVALGRALMANPRLLLLDEPSLGLAPKIVLEVFRAIQQIRRKGTPILIVEQNVRQTLELADRGYVLENGRMALSGAGSDLLHNEHIRNAYLGVG